MTTYDQMRDALIAIKTINDKRLHDGLGYEINDILEKALAIPRRNCDVGTPEEQYKRYSAFTSRWTPCSFNGHARCAGDCPVNKKLERDGSGDLQCPFVWAQTPYDEKEGARK